MCGRQHLSERRESGVRCEAPAVTNDPSVCTSSHGGRDCRYASVDQDARAVLLLRAGLVLLGRAAEKRYGFGSTVTRAHHTEKQAAA